MVMHWTPLIVRPLQPPQHITDLDRVTVTAVHKKVVSYVCQRCWPAHLIYGLVIRVRGLWSASQSIRKAVQRNADYLILVSNICIRWCLLSLYLQLLICRFLHLDIIDDLTLGSSFHLGALINCWDPVYLRVWSVTRTHEKVTPKTLSAYDGQFWNKIDTLSQKC